MISWLDWQIFMISGSNKQLQQELEYTRLDSDYHSWWISKMQSGRDDTLEERYAIKLCFKLGKNDVKETHEMLQTTFGASCMNRASDLEWHKRFKEGRESVRDDERCWGSKEVNTPEYSNCCFSSSFQSDIIKIGQPSHKMYSNNILTSQESTTILNACTKKTLDTYWRHHVYVL